MPVTPPISPEQAPESTKAIYERIKDTIGKGQVPLGFQMMGHVDAFLQDSYMNVRKFVYEGSDLLDRRTRHILALATSSAQNCVHCVRQHAKEAGQYGLSENEVAQVLAVTATCAMYNNYYKFKDLSGDSTFEGFSVGLRAHTFMKSGLDEKTVELINIVVSNINGCEKCTSGHVKKALQLGLSHEQIDEAMKVSATTTAFNTYHRTQ